MIVRVIEKQEEGLDWKDRERLVTHYIPQYYDEIKGWKTCRLDNTLVARYYFKVEDAIDVCKKFVEKDAKVVWFAPKAEDTIDWEQRRYEIAKEMLSSSAIGVNASQKEWMNGKTWQEASAILAISYADALVKELKKGVDNGNK